MHKKNSTRFIAASLVLLTTFGGCKMFSGQSLDEPGRGISLKDSPSQKLQPRSLADITGETRKPPPIAPSEISSRDTLQPLSHESSKEQGISLDDVSLEASNVHVDADIDIEDLETDAQEQLPQIVESAVHPYSRMSSPFTISDQSEDSGVGNSQPPMHPVQTTRPETTEVASETSANREASPPSSRPTNQVAGNASVPQKPKPASSEPNNSAAPERTESLSPAAGSTGPVMRIVAEPDGVRSADRISAATDHLFADTNSKTQGDVSIVTTDSEKNLAEAPPESGSVQQETTPVQAASHQQPIQTSAVPARPATGTPTELANTAPPSQSVAEKQLNWQQQLATAIQQMDQEIAGTGQSAGLNQQIRLQLLRIAAGEVSSDSLDLAGDDENLRSYWQHQLAAIGEMLDDSDPSATTQAAAVAQKRRRVTNASELLEKAHSQLASISTMRLVQCAFASEVRGFGQFTTLPSVFQPSQQVLIYCEIENYSLRESVTSGKQLKVAELQGQFAIVDASNRIVYQHQYQPVQDVAQRRRKDFYMFFPVTVPNLSGGQYRLQLSVEDLVGKQVASYSEDMVFNVSGVARSRPQPRVAATPPSVQTTRLQQVSPPVPSGTPNPTISAPMQNAAPPVTNTNPTPAQTPAATPNINQPLPMNRNQQPSPNARVPMPENGSNMPLPMNRAYQQVPSNQSNMPLPMNRTPAENQPIPGNGQTPSSQRR